MWFLLFLVLPSFFWLVWVWAASVAERRAFLRQVNLFDDVTSVLTPRVNRKTLIPRAARKQTLKMLTSPTLFRFKSARDSSEEIAQKMNH